MTIKVQCGCGTRYAFEVEPQDGVMPFRVNCPGCNADGTEAANQILAQSAPPRLRRQAPAVAAAVAPSETDLPPPALNKSMEKFQAEARQMRRFFWIAGGVALLILGLMGAWGWYSFVGTKPRLDFALKLAEADSGWHTEFLDGGRLLLASSGRASLYAVHTRNELWSAALPGQPGPQTPQVFVDKSSIWLCTGSQVARLDVKSGELKQTTPIAGALASFTPTASSLLVVSALSDTRRAAMSIDLASGEVSTRDINVPRAQQHAMPDELPANVQPTAGVLLAQATEEHKFNKPLNAVSSEFFSAGQNLVELRVTLLEPNVDWVKSIKPRGPSLINGNTTSSTSTAGVEEEVFNDIKRDQTGGVKAVDNSLYEVRLRRWLGDAPVEWKDKVRGVPMFFSLETVDLLVAGKSLTVFDKQNNKLFEAKLSYPIAERFTEDDPEHPVPAVERAGALYFFDQGVLTAFSLPGGEVQWRLTSVGISQAQFDAGGALYVDSTTAAPEDIQYSDQIKLEKTPAVILKVDAHSGKILWQAQDKGKQCFLTGKYVYTSNAEKGGAALAVGLAEAVNAPRPEAPVNFYIYRLDPETGKVLWMFYEQEDPDEEVFQDNCFVLRLGGELQVWKYLDF